jgi:hypothetical protein
MSVHVKLSCAITALFFNGLAKESTPRIATVVCAFLYTFGVKVDTVAWEKA